MTLPRTAFYDPNLSYEQNYESGPPILHQSITPPHRHLQQSQKFSFLDRTLSLPFGIPAGPLLNSQYMRSAFEYGFDVSTYKTVRTQAFPSHPFPNILYVRSEKDLHPDKTPRLIATESEPHSIKKLTITNSFGVPSKDPSVWQEDVKKALSYASDRQLLIISFMGTVRENQTQDQFIDDFAQAAILSTQTGAEALEANLSCPNIGNEGLVCFNLDVTEAICQAIRKKIGKTPLILKVGYYKDNSQLEKFAAIAERYAQAIAAINTLQVEVVNEKGEQALPGKNRSRSGVCGASIRWAGIDMIKRLSALRKKFHYSFSLVGIGGVMSPEDYFAYRRAGADLVQSATGAMWNPLLAYEIWKAENSI